jgi:hypothetical protein
MRGKSRYCDLGLVRAHSRPVFPVFDGAPDFPLLHSFDSHHVLPQPPPVVLRRFPSAECSAAGTPWTPRRRSTLAPPLADCQILCRRPLSTQACPLCHLNAYRASTSLHRHDDGARQGVRPPALAKVLRAAWSSDEDLDVSDPSGPNPAKNRMRANPSGPNPRGSPLHPCLSQQLSGSCLGNFSSCLRQGNIFHKNPKSESHRRTPAPAGKSRGQHKDADQNKGGQPQRKAAQENMAAKDTDTDPLVKLERAVGLLDRSLLSKNN